MKKNLAQSLVALQADLHTLTTNAEGYGYTYLTLDKLIDETRPILARHGFAIAQPLTEVGGEPAVQTMLLHASGEHITGTYPIAKAGMQKVNDAQQFGAAVTYARRYGWASMIGVCATADDDAASLGAPQNGKPQQQGEQW